MMTHGKTPDGYCAEKFVCVCVRERKKREAATRTNDHVRGQSKPFGKNNLQQKEK